MIIFFKSKIPGGASADLFAAPVDVSGYVTKQGTYVAPHHATRLKHMTKPQHDLFSVLAPEPGHAAAPAPSTEAAPASQATKEVGADTWQPAPPAPADAAKEKPMQPEQTRAASPPEAVAEPVLWGVSAGVTKKERRRLNAAAVALLEAKRDEDMTPADRAVLARYSGQGGVGDSLNEFYTPVDVASAMWAMLQHAGFAGGDVLEPSSGTGVFLHTAPVGARVAAVELDPVSARIAGILHRPAGHEVNLSSLERFATQDGRQFDAVIGNAPFGVRGALIRDDKPDLATAETYFVDTALDKTKDGGLVAMIVPTGIMSGQNARGFREQLLRKAEFLGAQRMPNTAFDAAHTDVTTDILLFRKRPQEVAGALSTVDQATLKAFGVWDAEFLGGDYFTGRGAANVLGTVGTAMRAYGEIYTVTGSMQGVADHLAQWRPETPAGAGRPLSVEAIVDALGDDEAAKRRAISAALKPPYQVAKVGDVKVVLGVRYVLAGAPPRWHRAEEELAASVAAAQAIAERLDDLAEGRARDAHYARAALTEELDNWIRLHGIPARNKDLLRWLAHPTLPNVDDATPEDHGRRVDAARRRTARLLGAVGDDGAYSDLVTGHTRKLDAASLDTVAAKLALETGGFSVDQLEVAAGGSADSLLDHLFASPLYAVDPDGKTWTTMDSYISGELWPKLDAANAAAAHEGIAPEYRAKYEFQARALEEAIQPQSLEDVEITLTSGFIKLAAIEGFFAAEDAAYRERNPQASWSPGQVALTYDGGLYEMRRVAKDGFGSSLDRDQDLALRMLNRYGVKKDEQDKVARLNRAFRDWLLTSEFRDEVEETYNRTHRGYRAPAESDAPIAIPGLNPALDVNAYHYAGLRWALRAQRGIIAADVGLGKTGRALMLARLAKVTGQATKPTIVVPKSVLANWMRECEFWFPGSRVLVIGETYSTNKAGETVSKPDTAADRRRKYHELQQNDYDFVLISQPAWNDLDINPILKGQYANDDFWAKRGDKLGNAGSKRLNEIRQRHAQALAAREFGKREETIYFDELGIDMLILDEGHGFKNLFSARQRFGENPKFLGGSGESNRAQDTFFKTKALREKHGDKGVFMLTATPTKNSPLEVYSMLSHVAPEAFERMGIKNSEDFLDRFCEFKMDTVLGTGGQIEEQLITAGFKNLAELREVMRRFIDRKTAEDVGLVLPARQDFDHFVDMTEEQEEVYGPLREAAQEHLKGGDAEGTGHIFSIMSRMGKASIDLSLLGMTGAAARSPKIDKCAEMAAKGAADGGQVIFCDHVEVHPRIADALVKQGIPRDQIGIINAQLASSGAARQKISDDFNVGKLRVVIGNTATMGEGVNLQKGTTDIHHLDLPWEPASLQQRNGRGLRQGNKKERVRIHSYLARRSFDGYRWQTVAAKKDWQDLLWNGGDRVENLAREGAFDRDQMLIMMSADPEAAAKKYAADKKLAEEKNLAEQRGRVVDMFGRFQQMQHSVRKLRERGQETAALKRAEFQVERLRDMLRDNRYFPHKHLLDSNKPAVIEPVTDTAWTEGSAFELAGGSDGPIHWSNEPSKWVVTEVDPTSGSITARPYAAHADSTINIDVARMKAGVTPFSYDKAAESAEVGARLARMRQEKDAKTEARAKSLLERPTWESLKGMPRDIIDRHEHELRQRMADAMSTYSAGYQPHVGFVSRDGHPVLSAGYSACDMTADHDLIMPSTAGREQSIRGFVDLGLRRETQTRYVEARRGFRSKADGIKGAYPGFEYDSDARTNPWGGVLDRLFGASTRAEAERRLDEAVNERVKEAKRFRDAMVAAQPALRLELTDRTRRWPASTVRALYHKARELGVLDTQLTDAAPPSNAHRTDLHPDVYNLTGSSYPGRVTVGEFLRQLPGGKEAAEEAE